MIPSCRRFIVGFGSTSRTRSIRSRCVRMSHSYSAVWVTVPNEEVGNKVATSVLEARLAACVNFIPQVKSMYWWDGKLNTDSEILLMMKTKTALVPELTENVKKSHTYSVPEVISAQLGPGNEQYYKWIDENTK